MNGWSGVSYVGGGDGDQVGAAAAREDADRRTDVTVAPGESGVERVRVADPGAYGDDCDATPVDGFRVYPPDNRRSVYVERPGTGCASADVDLLTVWPVTAA